MSPDRGGGFYNVAGLTPTRFLTLTLLHNTKDAHIEGISLELKYEKPTVRKAMASH